MKKEYYLISEAINVVKKINPDFGIKEFANLVAQKIMCPIVHLLAFPAYACEGDGSETSGWKLFVCGFCYITAYWHVPEDEIINMMNIIAKGALVDVDSAVFINTLHPGCIISSWQIDEKHFDNDIPPERFRLKKTRDETNICAFIFRQKVTVDNFVITADDFKILIGFLSKEKTDMEATIAKSIKSHKAKLAGKKSGEARTTSVSDWDKTRLAILQIAKDESGQYKANKLAELAVRKKISLRDSSTIAKDIRDDSEFKQYLKK